MTKTCKRTLFITVLTLLLSACMCFAVGCDNGSDDTAVEYTVTVTTGNEPASGVKVTVKKGGAQFGSETTGNDGKVTFKLVPDSYTVTLSDLPDHYGVAENAKLDLTATDRNLTVTLAKNFGYVVKLVGPDKQPYYNNGTTLGVCTLDGNCLSPVSIGADGSTFLEAPASDYHVKIENLPHNVAYEHDEEGYYTGKNFSATDTEMTIQLYSVIDVLAQTEMTATEKAAYAEDHYSFDASKTSYKLTGTLKAGETKFFSITPAYSSKYNIYTDYAARYLTAEKKFSLTNLGNAFYIPVMQAGETYYYSVSNMAMDGGDDITFECVISAPTASYHEVTGTGTVTVTLENKDSNAVIALSPKTAAAYKLTVNSEELADIVYCPSAYNIENTEHETFTENATASAKIVGKEAGGKTLYFAIAAKDAPATLKVKVEKLNDITDTKIVKHVEKQLTDFENQDGTLTYVPVDGTAELHFDEANGYYTLGEGGPIVVVRLTKAINDEGRFYANGALVYLENTKDEGTLAPYIFDITPEEDLNDLTKGNTSVDYRIMLRGFADYELDGDGNLAIPENITETSYYAKHVNKDGVYPLTKELEEYLKLVAENHSYNMPLDAAPDCAWLFACYYYEDPANIEAIVGTYELVSFTEHGDKYVIGSEYDDWMSGNKFDITSESFVLRVTNTGFTITDNLLYVYEYKGTWTKDGDTYKLCLLVEKQNPDTYVMEEVEVEVEATVDTENGKITIAYVDEDKGIDISFEFTKQAE